MFESSDAESVIIRDTGAADAGGADSAKDIGLVGSIIFRSTPEGVAMVIIHVVAGRDFDANAIGVKSDSELFFDLGVLPMVDEGVCCDLRASTRYCLAGMMK